MTELFELIIAMIDCADAFWGTYCGADELATLEPLPPAPTSGFTIRCASNGDLVACVATDYAG